MKLSKTFAAMLLGFVLTTSAGYAKSLGDDNRSPNELWKEYVELRPPNEELISMFSGGEPYRSWAIREILQKSLSEKDLLEIVIWHELPEPTGTFFWEQLKQRATIDDLLDVARLPRHCQEKALHELFKQELTKTQTEKLLSLVVENREQREKIWKLFLAKNPSEEDLVSVVTGTMNENTSTSSYQERATAELLTRSRLSNNALEKIFWRVGEEQQREVAQRLLGQEPTLENLRQISLGPEPFAIFARQMLDSRDAGRARREQLRILMAESRDKLK